MKKMLAISATLLAAACTLNLAACGGKSDLLKAPEAATPLSWQERQEAEFTDVSAGAERFAASFSSAAYNNYSKTENFAVAPVSVYMGLSVAAACAAGNTQEELLSALGVSYNTLAVQFSDFYRSLTAVYYSNADKVKGRLDLSNSIWVNKGTYADADCLDTLAERFHCYSYTADFAKDNKSANLAVKEFVKQQTHGLINNDFQLPQETLFTIINALYLKDVWNTYGNDLPFTASPYDFTAKDGSVKKTKLLQGYYKAGRVYETESYSTFYTSTDDGYKIKFILPKVNCSVDEIFTAENLAEVNARTDYNADDYENQIHYYTRCLFPEFKAAYNEDVRGILTAAFGINDLFIPNVCDLTALTGEPVEDFACAKVQHVTDLTVNKKGIEGAAVTVIPAAGAAGPDGWELVYEDFVLDSSFGFILTDRYNTTLFSGVVHSI